MDSAREAVTDRHTEWPITALHASAQEERREGGGGDARRRGRCSDIEDSERKNRKRQSPKERNLKKAESDREDFEKEGSGRELPGIEM